MHFKKFVLFILHMHCTVFIFKFVFACFSSFFKVLSYVLLRRCFLKSECRLSCTVATAKLLIQARFKVSRYRITRYDVVGDASVFLVLNQRFTL